MAGGAVVRDRLAIVKARTNSCTTTPPRWLAEKEVRVGAPDTGQAWTVRVVAAALIQDGRVLAARRRPPHRLGGGWEFPGGKVEPGEDDVAALIRECREELSVDVAVAELLGSTQHGDLHLVLYASTVVLGSPRPGVDHDELRWLGRADVTDVPWLPVDRALIGAVRPLLS